MSSAIFHKSETYNVHVYVVLIIDFSWYQYSITRKEWFDNVPVIQII